MQETNINFQKICWKKNQSFIKEIRTKVFIEEQNIPIDLEWDTYDITAKHFAVFKNGQPIAYARVVQKEGALWIGRMAVDKSQRSKGIGSFLIQQAIKATRSLNPNQEIYVSAQLAAIDFYKKNKFETVGEQYLDAGIFHKDMKLVR